MKMMSKAEAIRQISANDPSKSNHEIKEEVFRKYGFRVESNQIIGILGKQGTRYGAAFSMGLTLAKKFIQTIGNYADALRMLRLAKGDK